jgi:membrane protease subunit HflC
MHFHAHGDDDHHGHDHGHHHGHDHGDGLHGHAHAPLPEPAQGRRLRVATRFALALAIVGAAVLAASSIMVPAGEAIVVTRFGDLRRVLTHPGMAWKLPTPIESAIPVDLRLRTTSTGLQDVGTRDGLRILVQAYVAWQVPDELEHVRQFLRAVRNEPDEAARQLRSFVGAALQTAASSFDLAELVNTDPARVRIAAFEERLRAQVEAQALAVYGARIQQVGIERMTLPGATLTATVARMAAERDTVAAERTARGLREANEIRVAATRDARITVANGRTQAAEIEAQSRQQAAEIQARAYESDPQLYQMLRSMDTLATVVGNNTRLILRTDSAPFNMLVEGPPKLEPDQTGPAIAGGGH